MESEAFCAWLQSPHTPWGPMPDRAPSSSDPETALRALYADLERVARERLGEDAAQWLPGLLRDLETAGDPLLEDVWVVLDSYLPLYGQVMSLALLAELRRAATPGLVEALGGTRRPEVVEPLLAAVSFERADAPMRVALAGACGELGGARAARALTTWRGLSDVVDAVREEIDVALETLARG